MSSPDEFENAPAAELESSSQTNPEGEATEVPPPRRLDLKVDISDTGPCKKHLKVEIHPKEITTQFTESLVSMRKEAQVPGFRTGRAPVTLVQKRFKKEVSGQVKSTLVMSALEQIDKDYKLAPISRPEFDIESIEIKEGEPLQFEMEVEVQPDFPLPDYKSLTAVRPVRKITDTDIDAHIRRFLDGYSEEIPKLEGGAEVGDLLTVRLQFQKDGVLLNPETPEVKIRLQPELRFQDGHVPELDKILVGARPGDVREGAAHIGTSSPDPALRGQTIQVVIEVLDLKSYRIPEVNDEFLASIGFEDQDQFRSAIRNVLERRAEFSTRQAVRRSILDQLVEATPFGLPPDLVRRQEQSTLRRMVFELRQEGMTDKEIKGRESEIRSNAHENTLRSLKEFFILSRIAEAEDLKVEEEDIDLEIERIAARSDESPRRVRARIIKEGLDESLTTQILERKAIDKILDYAKIEEVDSTEVEKDVETVEQSAGPALVEGDSSEPDEPGEDTPTPGSD